MVEADKLKVILFWFEGGLCHPLPSIHTWRNASLGGIHVESIIVAS